MNQMRINFLDIGRKILSLPRLLKELGGGSFLWFAGFRWKAANNDSLDWSTISLRSLKAVSRRLKRATSFR
jgi:hypothetical protein